jgi:hypothetical protein
MHLILFKQRSLGTILLIVIRDVICCNFHGNYFILTEIVAFDFDFDIFFFCFNWSIIFTRVRNNTLVYELLTLPQYPLALHKCFLDAVILHYLGLPKLFGLSWVRSPRAFLWLVVERYLGQIYVFFLLCFLSVELIFDISEGLKSLLCCEWSWVSVA